MQLTIYGDPVLRKKCDEVRDINGKLKDIARDMFNIMKENSGIGLAASQVGIAKRFFAIDCTDKESGVRSKLFLINPIITDKDGVQESDEGCLSIPGFYEKVQRSAKINISYLNLDGKRLNLTADSFLAVILQHEIDHLDGILFIDHLSRLKRELFKNKWNKLVKSAME
ncbi:MAG: peptide deformylase [bacterium]|nr:MAG: peptide deformylase [bacterium]